MTVDPEVGRWLVSMFALIDRHVPLGEIPESLDAARLAAFPPAAYTPVRVASIERVVGQTCIGYTVRRNGSGVVDTSDEVVLDFADGSELSVAFYNGEVAVEGD
jgi:hypothetical protein